MATTVYTSTMLYHGYHSIHLYHIVSWLPQYASLPCCTMATTVDVVYDCSNDVDNYYPLQGLVAASLCTTLDSEITPSLSCNKITCYPRYIQCIRTGINVPFKSNQV